MFSFLHLYYSLILCFTLLSIYFFYLFYYNGYSYGRQRFKRNRYKEFTDYVKEQLYNKELDSLISKSGLKFNSFYFQIVRYSLFSFIVLYSLFNKLRGVSISQGNVALVLILFVLSSPKLILNQKTPFHYLLSFFTSEYRNRKNKEIYRAIMQLKNISIIKASANIGADFIINELNKFTNVTKPIFDKMLSFWYLNERKKAIEYFSNAIDTKQGKELALLFDKLDYLDTSELITQIELYQNNVRTERQTQYEKKNEVRSNIAYGVVMISAIIVLINFIIVTIYIDAINLYRTVF